MTGNSPWGYRIIGAFKLLSALMLGAAGFGIFRLLNRDLGEFLEHTALRLHLDPENRLVHGAVRKVAAIDHAHMKVLGLATFFYAALELVEGVGLLLQRRWAGYLTVLATALLLIPEGYELAHKVNPVRIGVLLVNLGILAYLAVKLWREEREPAPGRA